MSEYDSEEEDETQYTLANVGFFFFPLSPSPLFNFSPFLRKKVVGD